MESSLPTLQYFFCIFYLVCKLFKGLFQPVCQSVNCMSWVFESEHISEISSNGSINIFLRPCSIAIYGKFYLYCLYHFRLFSSLQIVKVWSINYALHFGSVRIHKHCLYWSAFSTDINTKIVFNCLLLFKLFLLVSKLYELSQ